MKKLACLSEKTSLWRWLCLRILSLAIGAIIVIAACMWLRFALWNAYVTQHMPETVRAEFKALIARQDYTNPHYHQITDQYYGKAFSSPNITGSDWRALAILVLIALPIIVILGLWRARPLSQQFSYIARSAREVTQGKFDTRTQIVEQAPLELTLLANDFNQMTTQLERYERELRESSAALAHELRTPLNAAMGRIQGMIDGVFPLQNAQLTMVIKQLEQLNHVIQDLHFLSLARAGQLILVKTPFYLEEVISERLSWYRPQLEAAGFCIQQHIEQTEFCVADLERLGQVFSILIENVLNYASEGKYLGIHVIEQEHQWVISLSDHGQGIDRDSLPMLFDRFWRAEHSRGRHSGGSGLGLSIASAIITAHSGTIHAVSAQGKGLTIVITLPRET
ncbi:ATP-binding protein [Pectobacteriaceae bacterium C52]|nr:ATP-binding protein [Pectobacteriaceae bacterium C52]